jgi:multidrug resistance efflux pump
MPDADGTERDEIPFVGPQGRSPREEDRHLRIAEELLAHEATAYGSGMDLRREPKGPGRRIAAAAIVLLALLAATVLVSRLRPASPIVNGDLIVTAQVEKGALPVEVRGWGQFATDQVQKIEATVAGRVASVHVGPGDVVQAGTPLVELASPDLALDRARAEQEFTAARAAFTALRFSLGTQRLEREASLVDRRAEMARATREVEQLQDRFEQGDAEVEELVAAIDAAAAVEEQIRVEEEMLALLNETGDEQVLLEKEKLVALAEVLEREKERLAALAVQAPGNGVVESVDISTGDWVTPGTRLVRLIRPERLRADLKVPYPAAKKVRTGSVVHLVDAVGDTTGGEVQSIGEAVPDAGGKHVRVSVRLESPPRADAAVDAGVDAVIELGVIDDALFVKRPAWTGEESVSSVFRVAEDRASAERVQVKFGAGSWERVQVLDGLKEGDEIIVSDMSRFGDAECVRIQ